jgi:hypothetical protein
VKGGSVHYWERKKRKKKKKDERDGEENVWYTQLLLLFVQGGMQVKNCNYYDMI